MEVEESNKLGVVIEGFILELDLSSNNLELLSSVMAKI
jgi:hypothetical protein